MLASVASSVSVVHRFLSLLAPIDGSHLSPFYELFLNNFNLILSSSKREPRVFIPFSDEFQITVHGFLSDFVANPMTAVFWIWHDPTTPRYKPQLFSVRESDDELLEIRLEVNHIHIVQVTKEFDTVAHIHIKVPAKAWSLLTLVFNPGMDKLRLSARCDLMEPDTITLPPMKWKRQTVLSCKIGGVGRDSNSQEFPSRLIGFGFFKVLAPDLHGQIFERGPVGAPLISTGCLFYHQLMVHQDIVEFIPLYCHDCLRLEYRLPHLRPHTPFAHILINCCQIELILPLFQQLAMTTIDGESILHFLEELLSLLVNIFALDPKAERSFTDIDGFGMIAHCLLQLPHGIVNYSIYIGFFGILESLAHSDSQTQCVDVILMNWEMWGN
jgi:hypothetical protein